MNNNRKSVTTNHQSKLCEFGTGLAAYAGLVSVAFAAAGWDAGFPQPSLNTGEVISAIAYGNSAVYVAAINSAPVGRLLQYKTNTWTVVSSDTGGRIDAMSQANGTLFLGGTFTVTVSGGAVAHNLARIDLSTATWYQLKDGSGNEGTDGPVHAIAAYYWQDSSSGTTQTGTTALIGGSFTHVGGLTAIGAAQWKGTGTVVPAWTSISLDSTSPAADVKGIAADINTTYSQYSFNAVYLTGAFQKTIGGSTAYNAVSWNGGWSYKGDAFMQYNLNNCTNRLVWYPGGYTGSAVTLIQGTPYFGGFGQVAVNASNAVTGVSTPDTCNGNSVNLYAPVGLETKDASGITTGSGLYSISNYPSYGLQRVYSLSTYSLAFYIAGLSADGVVSALVYSGGALSALPSGSGSPLGAGDLVTMTAISGPAAYFASPAHIYKYNNY
jgi:hypothetical protein